MTFLANPCSCGWSMDDIDEYTRKCERCGRTAVLKSGLWVISKPTEDVEQHEYVPIKWNPRKWCS